MTAVPDFFEPIPSAHHPLKRGIATFSAHDDANLALDSVRALATSNLFSFAKLIAPERVFGEIHKEVFDWLQNSTSPNQLLLLPRAHMKSFCIAVWCAWWITKHPETTILYVSATSTLAEEQLYAIKNILTSKIYMKYWPEMCNPEEGKREKWSSIAISVDHPRRREEGTRDPTVRTAGLTSTTTGLHADVVVADDVVVPENAYTADGRAKCAAAMSQMASILNPGGFTKACGTRYHPADQYQIWKDQVMPVFDTTTGEHVDDQPIWDIKEHVVEEDGVFLWPRTARRDGKMFGFDRQELARISTMYSDRTQFQAQYYNDPNDPESARLDESRFQYFDHKNLTNKYGTWYYKDDKLNLFAGIDFAYTTHKRSDYTAICVIGVDAAHNIYVLDLTRFKTDKIQEYYDQIDKLHQRWGFTKLRAEVTAAQSIIVGDLKDRIKANGGRIKIDPHKPNRQLGSKEERIAAVLEPRYDNLQIYHYRGGYIPMLEEELLLARPAHDDLKDVLAFTVEKAKAPRERVERDAPQDTTHLFNSRFGGVAFR